MNKVKERIEKRLEELKQAEEYIYFEIDLYGLQNNIYRTGNRNRLYKMIKKLRHIEKEESFLRQTLYIAERYFG